MPIPRLDTDATALLIVDMQQRLIDVMDQPRALIDQTARLIRGATALNLPIIVTEQYPKGLGPTAPVLADLLTNAIGVYDKLKFSACIEPVRTSLNNHGIRSVLVAGIETHICLQHTCYDLMDAGYIVAGVRDATSSRQPFDRDTALQRMAHAGVVPTTVEAALFELVHEAGGDKFNAIRHLIK